MDLSPVIARLKAQLSGLKSIGGAADLDAAIDGVVAMPACFVLPLAESGKEMDLLSQTAQSIRQTFGVVHVLGNRRDATGAAALVDLAGLRTPLRAALVGWVPDASNGEAVYFTGGRLLRLDGDGRLWWIDEFEVKTYYWSP